MSCINGFNLSKDTTVHYLQLAARHSKSSRDDLILRVKKVLQVNPAIIYNKTTKLARQFYLRVKEVMGEYHRLNAFIRFEAYPEYLLVSEVRAEHDVLDLMFNYFRRRYPDYIIVLNTGEDCNLSTRRSDIQFPQLKVRRNYWYFAREQYSLDEIRAMIRVQLPEILALDDFSPHLWECYYDSQYIKARKNLRLARKAIPKKMIEKSAGGLSHEARRFDEAEKTLQTTTLLQYLPKSKTENS